MKRDRIKNSLQKELHSLCGSGNSPTTLLLEDNLPNKIHEAKESSKLTSHLLSQLPRYTGHQNLKEAAKQRITFSPRPTNTNPDIAHNTKTIDNTGVNKHSKYKALRHTIHQGILQIQK